MKRLNLTEVAASFGYLLDRKKSSAGSVFMRSPTDADAVIITKAHDGHFVFCSVTNTEQSGSVIDFVAHRIGAASGGRVNIGRVRQHLRPWTGGNAPTISPTAYARDLQPIERDIAGVRARFVAMRPLESGRHTYLNEVRCIPPTLLAHPRFADRVRTDDRGNAIFPHFDAASGGICGYEIKGTATRFSKGGGKGLWCSGTLPKDRKLVVTESAIDALSYAALNGWDFTRFVSLAGQVSPEQVELVRAAIAMLPGAPEDRGEVIIAVDTDEAGDSLISRLTEVFGAAGRHDQVTLRVHRPDVRECDWNSILANRRENHRPPLPDPIAE